MSSPERKRSPHLRSGFIASTIAVLAVVTIAAHATLPPWMQHVVGASSIEAALFRAMPLPSVQAMYPRPPKESQAEFARLIAAAPDDAQLYALRARSDEAALDFPSAEYDWKQSATHSKDPVSAKLELADFYQRRLLTAPQLATLSEVAAAPPIAAERFVNPASQRSWLAFERMLSLISAQGLPPSLVASTYQAFLARYPSQPAVYARFLSWQLTQKDWPAAEHLIARYRTAFPQDRVFPIRAQALLEYRRGDAEGALAMYDQSFDPLWPPELIQSYFSLLEATHRQRAFVAEARARLAQHPDGSEALNALARIFFYEQHTGRLDKAQEAIDAFRIARETRSGSWTPADLYTLAALASSAHSYAEAARYNYALASSDGNAPNDQPAAQAGLTGLIDLLLTAPDKPIALGAGDLSMYRDIATLDQGPGYWNGILSLWLNGTSPDQQYLTENSKAQSYFHRARAAALLSVLDRRFPAAPERAGLHAELILAYAQYGEPAAVVSAGNDFLNAFPAAPNRVEIAGLLADAYARQQNTAAEFALYDSLLTELAAKTGGLPLSSGSPAPTPAPVRRNPVVPVPDHPDAELADAAPTQAAAAMNSAASELLTSAPSPATLREANEYEQILDRYLGRLVAEKQIPRALTVLRHQLDLNPNEPQLYERLATFLAQNSLSGQQEEIYQLAVAKFQQPTWYDKLARLYLRQRNREAYAALTRQVTDIFAGTELDAWFRNVGTLNGLNLPNQPLLGPELAIQLNLYAQKRFPHDLVFTRNLIAAYASQPTENRAAFEDQLRHHWWEDESLRNEFFSYLSRSGKLQAELAKLDHTGAPRSTTSSLEIGSADSNPAATRELAEIDAWNSHFEQAAPLLGAVADLYPADASVGDNAVSLFRSLAYLDPTPQSTARAVALQQHLLAADPANADRLATLGDLYAEATSTGGEDLRSATPYWRRIPALHPGTPAGYLTSATIFWDYFQFDDALAELTAARTKFHQPTLFGYEAGAIAENRRDLPRAVAEYTAVATTPPDQRFFVNSVNAAVDAFTEPPSDAADSNLWSTTQSLFNAAAARSRLLRLATRPATARLVDKATAQAVTAATTPVTLSLRCDVLLAEHRPQELAALLEQALARARTPEQAATIGDLARTNVSHAGGDVMLRQVVVSLDTGEVQRTNASTGGYALDEVYEHALAKQIALSTDPVEKMQLSYTLSSALEARKDFAGAARIIDSVSRENPRSFGVVRHTTDFYLRAGQPAKAIATLLEAAKAATPDLGRNFTLEAAGHANDAGAPQQARALAEPMLAQTPYDATVLGIIATSYARANDDTGLKAFYLARLNAVKTASLTTAQRRDNTALLRRGLIPALTRQKDYDAAEAQYIALLSAFPEDSATAQQAALYALRYSRQSQLLDFLRTTVKQSPSDSRFAILLAQVDTIFEDFPGAIAAYSQAIAIRKDRIDLYTARVELELRVGQDEPAATDLSRLYLLSYRDPSWMLRLAELRARQQRPDDAAKALETAWITGQTTSAANTFRVADQLAQWNLLNQASAFAGRGVTQAGANLLLSGNGDAAIYARILARQGRAADALATLSASFRNVQTNTTFPAEMTAGYLKAGISSADLARARQQYFEGRRQTARAQLDQAVNAIGQVAQTYYTPEQKLTYAQALDRLHDSAQPDSDPSLALSAATAAGLTDREVEWRKQILLTDPIRPDALPDASTYIALEHRRLAFADLAQTLEAFAARLPATKRRPLREQAAHAWRDAGDETNELRLTRTLALAQNSTLRDRFLDLLLRHDRAALAALAASKDDKLADAAANFAVANATQAQALSAITARSRAMSPVWRPAMASLVLTNFAAPATAPTPATLASFTQALHPDATIAERLGAPADPGKQLTGELWFYYAGRYGLFLNTVPRAPTLPDPEDFLPAELERAPSAPAAYLHLARSYEDAGNHAASAAEYLHALEFAPNSPAVHDEYAVVLFRDGHREDALSQWRAALALMAKRQSGEEFFAAFHTTVNHLAERRLFVTLRPEVEAVLRPYFARNGNYRSNDLLRAVYKASATPAEGSGLILQAAGFASDPTLILEDLRRAAWVAPESREAILLRQIELERSKPPKDGASAPAGLLGYQTDLIEFYLDRNQLTKAQAVFDSIPAYSGAPGNMDRIILATREGHLQPLLRAWRDHPESAPSATDFESALYRLRKPTAAYTPDPAAIRPVEEFVFERKQLDHALQPTDFLSLAQTRLSTGDLPGALELLHRLSLNPSSTYENGDIHFDGHAEMHYSYGPADIAYHVASGPPNPYVNTDYAAALLEATHHPAEAIPFLTTLVKSVPWNAAYRLRLAEAELKSNDRASAATLLTAIVKDAQTPYATRVQAAEDLHTIPAATPASITASAELTLLASAQPPPPQAARQPYFAAARNAAAAAPSISAADRVALLHEAIAIAPEDPGASRARLDLLLARDATANASATLALFRVIDDAPQTAMGENDAVEPEENGSATEPDGSIAPANDEGPNPSAFPFLLAHTLDTATRIRLATLLSRTFEHEHASAQAIFYAQLAANLAAQQRPDPALAQRAADLKAGVRLGQMNALRRPLIHTDLDQVNQVRPRLSLADLARAEAP